MSGQTTTHKILYADAIRSFAMVSIVFLHVSSPIVQDFSSNCLSRWWIANIVYSLARPGIVLFIMISGMLLLAEGKEEPLGWFFRKRFMRIGIPFIAWGIFYFFWKNHGAITESTFFNLVREFIQGPIYYHLWFIYTMAGIYLATPIFRVYVKNASNANQAYLLILWFIGTALYPLIQRFTDVTIGIPIMVAGGFLGAFLLGNYIEHISVRGNSIMVQWLVLIVCSAFTTVSTYFMSHYNGGKYEGTFESFLSPNVIFMAACLFLIFKSIRFDVLQRKAPGIFKIIMTISSTSFSVYLMHIFVLEIFKNHIPWFVLDANTFHPLIGIPLTAIVTLVLCVSLIVVLRKIPAMKYVLP